MNTQKHISFPTEAGMLAGLALGLSGQFPLLIVSVVVAVILHRLCKKASHEVVAVSAFQLTVAIGAELMLISQGENVPLPFYFEPILLIALTLFLLLSVAKIWVWIEMAFLAFKIVTLTMVLFQGIDEEMRKRVIIGTFCLECLFLWLMVTHLRRVAVPSESVIQLDAVSGEDSKTP